LACLIGAKMKYKVLKSHNAKVDGKIVYRQVGDIFESEKINTILINLKAVELVTEAAEVAPTKPKKGG
jgi:predicted regulator of amino acid metabolism with ACT domain